MPKGSSYGEAGGVGDSPISTRRHSQRTEESFALTRRAAGGISKNLDHVAGTSLARQPAANSSCRAIASCQGQNGEVLQLIRPRILVEFGFIVWRYPICPKINP